MGLALFFLSGLNKSPTVKLAHKTAAQFSVGRAALSATLQRLKLAGLVTVERGPGQSPEVTILHVDLKGGPKVLPKEPIEPKSGPGPQRASGGFSTTTKGGA